MAIDRATRWVFALIYKDRSEASRTDFLRFVGNACLFDITKLLTDNDNQFKDRSTSLANNGWQALAALDGNNDKVINANDAAFTELKVWRDLNQDGISQAGEMQTLAQAGVASINIPTGNQAIGSYTTSTGTTRVAQNINFTTNNFYSEFTDNPAVTATAALLPQLQGAGLVRDLREAMSLGTAQSTALAAKVSQFQAASSTQERQALLEQVIDAWAATAAPVAHPSSGSLPGEEIFISNPQTVQTYFGAGLDAHGSDWRALFQDSSNFSNQIALKNMLLQAGLIKGFASLGNFGNLGTSDLSVWRKGAAEVFLEGGETGRKIATLESFNGSSAVERYTFVQLSTNDQARVYAVFIPGPAQAFFDAAYQSLKEGIYKSLYLQTAGKQYLDLIELVIDDKGLRLNFAAVNAALAQKIAVDPSQAATDLAEFIFFTTDSLASSGWDGAARLGKLRRSTLTKLNKIKACKRRQNATKLIAACARICWAKALKVSNNT